MESRTFFVVVIAVLLAGCFHRKQKDTVALDCHLYIENVEVNPFGVNEVYLTDSQYFRIYVGKVDVEHETFSFICKEGGVMVYKRAEDSQGKWRKLDSLFLNREDLTKHKTDSTRGVFGGR